MTDLQWFAFVVLPLCVGVLGWAAAVVGVTRLTMGNRPNEQTPAHPHARGKGEA
jgi:hypothetical protein